MSSLPRFALSCCLLVSPALVACGEEPLDPPAPPYLVGVSGGPRAGALEVVGLDETTRELLDALDVEVEGAGLAASGPGWARIDDAPAGPLTLLVSAPGRVPQRWHGVEGARAVITLPARDAEVRTLEGRITGAAERGAASVAVGPLTPPRLLRTGGLDAATPVQCAMEPDGSCRFRITVAASTEALVATLRDESGVAIGFAQHALDEADVVEIAATEGAARLDAVRLSPGTPGEPPAGLEAVIGVPGLLSGGGISVLAQAPATDGTLAAPSLSTLDSASWWMMHEARISADDGSSRSVVLVRGLMSPETEIVLPAFLPLPEATFEGDALSVVAPSAQGLVVVDWIDTYGETIASDLALASDAPSRFEARSGRARVRVVEAYGVSADALDVDAVEPTISRFAQIDVTR